METLNLKNISNELSDVKYKQYKIGIQLGIRHNKLKEFETENEPFSASINYWLNGNVKEVPVSWQSIVDALSSSNVDENGLAQKIAEKYCPPLEKGLINVIICLSLLTLIYLFTIQKVYMCRVCTVLNACLL